jgi:hypothetical protein
MSTSSQNGREVLLQQVPARRSVSERRLSRHDRPKAGHVEQRWNEGE